MRPLDDHNTIKAEVQGLDRIAPVTVIEQTIGDPQCGRAVYA
jgi:hypothetical protein